MFENFSQVFHIHIYHCVSQPFQVCPNIPSVENLHEQDAFITCWVYLMNHAISTKSSFPQYSLTSQNP